MEKLVRDFVPGLIACDPEGPRATFRIAPENERLRLVLDKIRDEADECATLQENMNIDKLADLMEAIGALMILTGWKNDDVSVHRDAKRKAAGGYSRFFVMRPVV